MTTPTETSAPVGAEQWSKLITQLAAKYTAGDPVTLLREMLRSLPTGVAMQATNYQYTDTLGTRHVVYNGVDFSLIKNGEGQYGTEITPFNLLDAEGKPAKREKYQHRMKSRTLDNAMLVAGHQAGAIGRRCAELVLTVKAESAAEKKPRANNSAVVRDELAEMRAQMAEMMKLLAEK